MIVFYRHTFESLGGAFWRVRFWVKEHPWWSRIIAVILIEDDAPADEPDLLGLYEGVPITERDSFYTGVLPDRIRIFKSPTLDMCDSVEELVEEVEITVVHEIAHFFGIDDDRLHDLGYA